MKLVQSTWRKVLGAKHKRVRLTFNSCGFGRSNPMGEISPTQRPVMLITAVISRHDAAFDWLRNQAIQSWGPVLLESPKFDFSETKFYTKQMGLDLKKQLLAFETLIDPADIAEIKIQSNKWELDYKNENDHEEKRPLNIDPGYVTEAKLVLATTKNRDHRIYLQKGIFAEITLFFQGNQWQDSRWTYPDFQRADFKDFFTNCRNLLRKRYQHMKTGDR